MDGYEHNRSFDGMTVGAENGELLNDIVYQRNRSVEEKYNVVLVWEAPNGATTATLRKEVKGGISDHDLFFDTGLPGLSSQGYLCRLNDMKYITLSDPWWDRAAVESLSVGGNLYFITGDILPSSLLASDCLTFNKRLFDNNDMEYPYQLAREGKWTLERFVEMTKGLTQDLNGDGEYTFGDDLFGLSTWTSDSINSLFYGAGGALSAKDENDYPYISRDMDKIVRVYDQLYQLFHENNSYFVTNGAINETAYENFANGNAFFCEVMLIKIHLYLRDMEDDFGIVPLPKYDEAQKYYLTYSSPAGPMAALAVSNPDYDRAGLIMNAIAASAHDTLTPKMYDLIVKTRNVRDEESVEMLEYVIRERVFDFAHFYGVSGSNEVTDALVAKKQDIASRLAKYDESAPKSLQKIIDKYAELE